MKIALIHNLYGKYSHGGAETAVELMAADFKKGGHEVFIITTKPIKESAEIAVPNIYYINSEFYNLADLNIVSRLFWQITNILSFKKYFAIQNILKKEKPDLVITHNLMGLGFLTPLAIKKLKIIHFHFLHDIQLLHPSGLMIFGHENILNSLGAKIYQSLTRTLFNSPAKIISPSKWLLDLHLNHGFFKKSQTELKPFDWGEPNNQPMIPVTKKKFVNFLFVGQIEEQKGVLLLIETFKNISDPEFRLTLASRNGGKIINKVKALIKNDQRIRILSPLTFKETGDLMKNSDCLIVPSLCYENSPTVIYGAHSANLPVIASRIGGIPEICKQNDLLFEPGNIKDLTEKILGTKAL